MNLRELLLQFAGQNEQLLQLEELIASRIPAISVLEETASSIRVAPTDGREVSDCVKSVAALLDKSGYEDYEIDEDGQDIVISI